MRYVNNATNTVPCRLNSLHYAIFGLVQVMYTAIRSAKRNDEMELQIIRVLCCISTASCLPLTLIAAGTEISLPLQSTQTDLQSGTHVR